MNVTGRHQWDVPILPNGPAFLRVIFLMRRISNINSNETFQQKLIIVVDLLYCPIAFCAKLSLFLLYYRLFSRQQWIRYLVYLGVGSVAAIYTATMIVCGYLCLPRPGQSWIEAGLSSRCHKQSIVIGYVQGLCNVLSDLYLLFLPLPAVWQLHLPLRKRLGLVGIFLTGSLWVATFTS